MVKKNCKVCNQEFETNDGRVKICSDECRKAEHNRKQRVKREENLKGEEGKDYIVCQWCKKRVKRIYGKHIKYNHPNKTSDDYKREFPGYPLYSEKDKENFSRSSGKHMKKEKYRKMVSEKVKGKNNPNHHTKRTEQERKETSPFSKEFYKKRGMNEEDRHNFINKAMKNRDLDTRIEYYLKRGYTKEKASKALSERQRTFSLEKCIQKYGEKEGKRRWEERQRKWKSKVFNKNKHISKGTSKLSEEIIDEIVKYNTNNDELLYGKNEKFIFDNNTNRAYKFDLTNKTTKKILEINGIYWHCKPELYEEKYYNKSKKMYAIDIWNYDQYKLDLAKNKGYDIKILWEDDYRKNPDSKIKECIDFIYEKAT
ncbi:MAG: hypothetical protein ACOC22_00745 [bacterium]